MPDNIDNKEWIDFTRTKNKIRENDVSAIENNIEYLHDNAGKISEDLATEQSARIEADETIANNLANNYTKTSDLADIALSGDYDDLKNKPDLTSFATKQEVSAGLDAKQDVISDLDTIRSGAALGTTAVQESQLAQVAISGDYEDLNNKPTLGTLATKDKVDYQTEVTNKPDLSIYAESSDLATVATTGDYEDLANKPKIPAEVVANQAPTSQTETLTNLKIGDKEYVVSGGVATTQYYYGSSTSSTTNTRYYIPSALKNVTVTGSTYIPYGAFYNCSNLTSIYISDITTSVGKDLVKGCSKATIYCFAEAQPSGWDAGWNPNNRPVVWNYEITEE